MKAFDVEVKSEKDADLLAQIQSRLDNLTKPPSSLGRLENFVRQYCLCRGNADARIRKKSLFVFAGDHGITSEGVAPFPREVTVQMVENMLAGGAAVTVMARMAHIDYRVVDMGVDRLFSPHEYLIDKKVASGTRSFLAGCAMEADLCQSAVRRGVSLCDDYEFDIAAIGEMGIGNTSSASALFALLLDKNGEDTVGRGTGADGELLRKKRRVVGEAVRFHRSHWDGTALDALRRVGGYEIAGMTGFILGCAEKRVPVVVDGFIATAASICAVSMNACVKKCLFFGHVSDEQFHRFVLEYLGVKPVLELGMCLGEGTGAVLGMQIIEQALNCYHNMATFSSAGVSNRDA
ncbi:MAG: nicotinate-nucleotide--dimethylbenzimidazole phosphoribosyltransferase [Chitinispirillaceae bacterium]